VSRDTKKNRAKMPLPKLTMGKDAVVSCLDRFLHPRRVIHTHFVNAEKNFRIENLRVRQREVKKIRGKDVLCLIVVSQGILQDDEPVELHAVEKHFKILIEGPRDYFFEVPVAAGQQEDPQDELLPPEVRNMLMQETVDGKDAAEVAGLVQVDNDNAPAPENIVGRGD
jgi:hypothetical protein